MDREVKIGCCGFPVGFKKYLSEFQVVEVEKTFYQPPENKILKTWREKASSDFEFTIKAWQLITHPPSSPTYRRLKEPISYQRAGFFRNNQIVTYGYQRSIEVAKILKARVLLFQTPPSFKEEEKNMKNLERFFKDIAKDKLIYLWEPRGEWNWATVRRIAKQLKIYIALDPFKSHPFSQKIVYFRLHGRGGYKYRYTLDDLKKLSEIIKGLEFKICYILFNNLYMWEDAIKFKRML